MPGGYLTLFASLLVESCLWEEDSNRMLFFFRRAIKRLYNRSVVTRAPHRAQPVTPDMKFQHFEVLTHTEPSMIPA